MLPCAILGIMTVSGVLDVFTFIDVVFLIAIRIGFSQSLYTFYEPQFEVTIMNVTIIKEGNRMTEQLYSVGVTVSTSTDGNSATLETLEEPGDYSLGVDGVNFRQLQFSSDDQEIRFIFMLFGDNTSESTESFRAITSTVEGTPTFQEPITSTAFPSTIIRILDDDCKLNCNVRMRK